jgi:hypothetical protein
MERQNKIRLAKLFAAMLVALALNKCGESSVAAQDGMQANVPDLSATDEKVVTITSGERLTDAQVRGVMYSANYRYYDCPKRAVIAPQAEKYDNSDGLNWFQAFYPNPTSVALEPSGSCGNGCIVCQTRSRESYGMINSSSNQGITKQSLIMAVQTPYRECRIGYSPFVGRNGFWCLVNP